MIGNFTVYTKNNAHGSPFDLICCGMVQAAFTHNQQNYFVGTWSIIGLTQRQ